MCVYKLVYKKSELVAMCKMLVFKIKYEWKYEILNIKQIKGKDGWRAERTICNKNW